MVLRKPPSYLLVEPDRHGNVRYYARVKHRPKIRLRSPPGTPAFRAEHAAAIDRLKSDKLTSEPTKVIAGSFKALVVEYMASPNFQRLDPKTRAWQRRGLEWVCKRCGDLSVALMEPKHVRALRNEPQAPTASRSMLKALKAMFRWASELDKVSVNPALGVPVLLRVSDGYRPWSEEDREKFKVRHPVGTQARLAYALAFYAALRREDVVRMGPRNLRRMPDGSLRLRFRYAKNEHRNPLDGDLPVHPDLAAAIEAVPDSMKRETFIVSSVNKQFGPDTFWRWFKKRCEEAGLDPDLSIHGLRKAALTAIAEGGATTHELAAGGGHRSLSEVERYSRTASRSRLADTAIARLK